VAGKLRRFVEGGMGDYEHLRFEGEAAEVIICLFLIGVK